MIEWIPQVEGLFYAKVLNGGLFVGKSKEWTVSTRPYFWEVSPSLGSLPTVWGFADTLDEAKAMAIAVHALNEV